jgi:hypothetical protein
MPASLARRYDEPVEVERRDDAPVAFVRRGRRYLVRTVLGHWWETRAWWQADDLTAGVSDDEREIWRVEASLRAGSVAVVDLSFAWTTGCWAVDAVLD